MLDWSLIFSSKHSKCWIEIDIRNSKALHVFDIKHSELEFLVEFEVRYLAIQTI